MRFISKGINLYLQNAVEITYMENICHSNHWSFYRNRKPTYIKAALQQKLLLPDEILKSISVRALGLLATQ
jgi:hypothetical protein